MFFQRFAIKLPQHLNQCVALKISGLPVQYFQVTESKLVLTHAQPCALTITGGLFDWFVAMSGQPAMGRLKIEGDAVLAQDLFQAVQEKTRALPRVFSSCREQAAQRMDDLHYFLEDECTSFVPTHEIQAFCSAVDALNHHTERLEARLKLLEDKI